jgi:hypothetical protein
VIYTAGDAPVRFEFRAAEFLSSSGIEEPKRAPVWVSKEGGRITSQCLRHFQRCSRGAPGLQNMAMSEIRVQASARQGTTTCDY